MSTLHLFTSNDSNGGTSLKEPNGCDKIQAVMNGSTIGCMYERRYLHV